MNHNFCSPSHRQASVSHFWLMFGFMIFGATISDIAIASAFGGSKNAFDIQSGGAQNFNMPLKFEQGAYQEKLTAKYSTRPFGPGAAPYYDIRYRRAMDSSFWGLNDMWWGIELLHHKVWLNNLPAAVSEFRMTFGYNLIPFSVGASLLPWLNFYFGVGPVVVHPVNTVNGLTLPNEPITWPTGKRYSLVGAGMHTGVEARQFLWRNIFANADLRFMLTKAIVPIVGGRARVLQASMHGHLGLGVAW